MKHTLPILFTMLLCGMSAFPQEGCYSRLRNDTLTIGNSRIERRFVWNGGNLMTQSLTDFSSGQVWTSRSLTPDFKVAGDTRSTGGRCSTKRIAETDIHPARLEVTVEFSLGTLDVRRIYRMTLEGVGTEQIAAKLEEDGVLTPRAYWHSKGINRPGKVKDLPPTHWNSSSVIKMLSVQEYCGDILNFKTYSKSYKNKKRLENDRENWAIFKDVHEPIIERAVFEQVQQKRGKMRKRQAKDGERSMFSGLLVCADCGSNLHFHFNQGNPEIKYFNCSNYKGNRGTCGSTHYVRVDFLEQVVLGEIRRLTKYAGLYEDDFLKEVIGHSRQAEETERRLKEKELKSLLARDDELDGLFERIYEDNVSGKLSDDRFAKMSRRYEEEQKELSEKIKKLRSEIEKQSSRATSTDMFVSIVRKYTRARKLTPRMLNELVEKIEVYNAEKIDGEWVQRLRIHYNCVGEMNIPNEPALPIPAVTVNTRKGVFVSYTTDDRPAV